MASSAPTNKLAILGSWPDGIWPDLGDYPGKWEGWYRAGTAAPWRVWQSVDLALRQVIIKHGFVNIYIYYGQNIPVEYVARMDDFRVSSQPVSAPGPVIGADRRHNIWIHYAEVKQLCRTVPRDDFRELPYMNGQITCTPQPISEAGWALMHGTGLLFVPDPGSATL